MKKVWLSLALALVMLAGAGCVSLHSVDMTVALKSETKWDLDGTLTINGSGKEAVAAVLVTLGQWQSEVQSSGGKMTWKQLPADREGNTPVQFNLRDADPSLINSSFFSGAFHANTVDGQRQVQFRMNNGSSYPGVDFSLTLRGKKVISTNGEQNGPGAVTWRNPNGTMEAVIIEGVPGPNLLAILLIAAGVGIAILLVILLLRRRPKPVAVNAPAYPQAYPAAGYPQAQAYPPAARQSQFCARCGALLPDNAAFCPHCGAQR